MTQLLMIMQTQDACISDCCLCAVLCQPSRSNTLRPYLPGLVWPVVAEDVRISIRGMLQAAQNETAFLNQADIVKSIIAEMVGAPSVPPEKEPDESFWKGRSILSEICLDERVNLPLQKDTSMLFL